MYHSVVLQSYDVRFSTVLNVICIHVATTIAVLLAQSTKYRCAYYVRYSAIVNVVCIHVASTICCYGISLTYYVRHSTLVNVVCIHIAITI